MGDRLDSPLFFEAHPPKRAFSLIAVVAILPVSSNVTCFCPEPHGAQGIFF